MLSIKRLKKHVRFYQIFYFIIMINQQVGYSVTNQSIATKIGLTKYFGRINPLVHNVNDKVVSYTFNREEGPICMRGDQFYTSVRDGDSNNSENLVIYFQDGGVCFSKYCFSYSRANTTIPKIDLLNPQSKDSPVAKWNQIYAPYCDGSLFAGDAEHMDNLNGKGIRYHHGLANSSAVFEVAKMRFPNAKKILVAGSSGGSYGLLFSGILARHYFPKSEIIIMADSGIGIAKEYNPDFLEDILEEFKINQFIPKDYIGCKRENHMTCMFEYFLDFDPNVRIGMYTSLNDTVLSELFLNIPREEYSEDVIQQTEKINRHHPNRFRRFINNGVQHTSLIGGVGFIRGADWGGMETPAGIWGKVFLTNLKIGNLSSTKIGTLSMSEWLRALIDNNTDIWVDIQE